MCFGVLADADDFFKMIGPLLIFGVYIIGALAKGWTKSRQQESEEEKPSELRKAVQKRYQEIHQRQTGKSSGQVQQPRHTEPVRTVHSARTVEPPTPVRQVPRRTYPTHQVQAERPRRPVQHRNRPRNVQQKPVSVKTQAPKPAQRPQTVRSHEAKAVKQSRADRSLASMIRQPQNLRTAIILKEILDKPLALRDF
jgi:FtsZ-interacting cell division protein ZipA